MRCITNVRRKLILISLVVFFIQSCGPAAIETQALPIPSSISSTQETVQITLSTPEPTLAAATSTLPACMAANGHVEIHDITTDLLPQPLQYCIYLPPCYNEEPDRYYPVLYLIHGKDATDSQWIYLGATGAIDRLVAKGELPPFIVVMPRDQVWYEPAADNFGLAVVQLLVPWVDEHYRTLPERKYRAIGGLFTSGSRIPSCSAQWACIAASCLTQM